MSDPYQTRQRSAWVLAHAGRNPAARRRGERLAARARRAARYEAGVGDAAVGEVVTPNRIHRTIYRDDDHRVVRLLWLVIRETARALVAGPGVGAAWGLYGLWWRTVPSRGPMRWKRAAVFAIGVVPILLIVVAVVWMHGDVPALSWYTIMQLSIAAARLTWLVRAYGWEAATPIAKTGHGIAPIRIAVTAPDSTRRVVVRRKVTTRPPTPILVRTSDHNEANHK